MMSTAVWSRSMVLRSAIRLLLPARRSCDVFAIPYHPLEGRRLDARSPPRASVGPRPHDLLLGEPWREDTRTVDGRTREKWAHRGLYHSLPCMRMFLTTRSLHAPPGARYNAPAPPSPGKKLDMCAAGAHLLWERWTAPARRMGRGGLLQAPGAVPGRGADTDPLDSGSGLGQRSARGLTLPPRTTVAGAHPVFASSVPRRML